MSINSKTQTPLISSIDNPNKNKKKCVLCGQNNADVLLKGTDYRFKTNDLSFDLLRCRNCGLVYIGNPPSKKNLNNYYPTSGYYDNKNRLLDFYSDFIRGSKIRKIERYSKKGHVLDVGCGDGSLLKGMHSRGWSVYGTDISEVAYNITKDKLSNIYHGELVDCHFKNGTFDVVMMNHSFEHMPEPQKEITEVKRILKKSGLFYLSIPNIESSQFKVLKEYWHHLEIPRHLYHYSPSTITRLLSNNGLKVVKIDFPLFDFPLDIIHSLRSKWATNGYSVKEIFYLFPFIKIFSRWRSSMGVFACKS